MEENHHKRMPKNYIGKIILKNSETVTFDKYDLFPDHDFMKWMKVADEMPTKIYVHVGDLYKHMPSNLRRWLRRNNAQTIMPETARNYTLDT